MSNKFIKITLILFVIISLKHCGYQPLLTDKYQKFDIVAFDLTGDKKLGQMLANRFIEVESAKLRDQYSTDKARVRHMNNNLLGWNQLNFILWLIYYVIFLVIVYLLYSKQSENIVLTKNQKIYLGLGFLLFPFLPKVYT